ncbi:MAG: PAS domain-containing protein [Methylotenera sp.]|nr:PAS domain-containing protein [Oligoflexia bacterium]
MNDPATGENIFQEAIENGFDSVWILSLPDFKLIYSNREITERLLGYPLENYHEDPAFWSSIVIPEDQSIAIQANETCLREGSAEVTYRMQRKDDRFIWVRARLRLIRNASGHASRIIGTTTDITESREAQKVLVQSSKMSSLGEMASGIAHEINNPLAIIFGKASLLKMQLDSSSIDKDGFKDELSKIESTAGRIAKIIKGLRTFSRNSENDPMEETQISQIIEETLAFCGERIKASFTTLQVQVQGELTAKCRPAQISQVLLNLLSNAFDAVQKLETRWIRIEALEFEGKLQIRVIDSGEGISPLVASNMMQPFFTTKEVGKGTGLGLSISKGIMESHQGQLYLDMTAQHTTVVMEFSGSSA